MTLYEDFEISVIVKLWTKYCLTMIPKQNQLDIRLHHLNDTYPKDN